MPGSWRVQPAMSETTVAQSTGLGTLRKSSLPGVCSSWQSAGRALMPGVSQKEQLKLQPENLRKTWRRPTSTPSPWIEEKHSTREAGLLIVGRSGKIRFPYRDRLDL